MTFDEYFEKIEPKFVRNFDIYRNQEVDGRMVNAYAEYHEIRGRTFITRVDIVDKYELFERVYFTHHEVCTQEVIEDYALWMKELANKLQPSEFHLSTDFTAVLAFDRFDPEMEDFVKHFRFDRLYRLYFRGFSDVKLICVDLSTGKVYTNKYGKRNRKLYTV